MTEKKFNVYVRRETLKQSVLNDITSLAILCGGVLVNELTLQSAPLNFLLGLVGILWLISFAQKMADDQQIRSDDIEEVIRQLRKRWASADDRTQD